jgi:hypothetical protein
MGWADTIGRLTNFKRGYEFFGQYNSLILAEIAIPGLKTVAIEEEAISWNATGKKILNEGFLGKDRERKKNKKKMRKRSYKSITR